MSRVLPILFKEEMVRAILDGRKTVTRRVVKPQPDWFDCGLSGNKCIPMRACDIDLEDVEIKPPCRPRDILYVRETWRTISASCGGTGGRCKIEYRAGGTEEFDEIVALPIRKGRWRPSIHMPKAAARIWLKVTDVRVERLQEITDEQAKAEGIRSYWAVPHDDCAFVGNDKICRTRREAFAELWDSTIQKTDLDLYGWKASPWVWIIEFERCEKPEEGQYGSDRVFHGWPADQVSSASAG